MNLAGLRLNVVNGEQPKLQQVKTSTDTAIANKPQTIPSPSQQSPRGSDKCSSTDYASGGSTVQQRNSSPQYETPPSHPHSPTATKPAESEMTLPIRPSLAHPAPLNVRRSRAPRNNRLSSATLYREVYRMSPPSPGADDTPYVQFAIEQLTRDEELLGRARQGSISSQDYPIERLIPDEGLGYYGASASASRPATGPATGPTPGTAPTSTRAPAPGSPSQASISRQAPPKPRIDTQNRSLDDLFVPIDPAQAHEHPPLGYLPLVLRPAALGSLVCTCLLIIGCLLFCNIRSLQDNGLYDYDGTGTSTYFVFQFLPQILGLAVIYYIFFLQAAVYRIIPFASLSSEPRPEHILQEMSMLPTNFLIPDLRCFRWGKPAVGICLLVFWISYFTVPLLSCMFQTTLVEVDATSQWRWTSVQPVVWILICLYLLLPGATILLGWHFRGSRSALIWDPVSLADLIILFRKSNITADLDRSEISGPTKTSMPPKSLRLGYWTTSQTGESFYAIGEEHAPARKPSQDSTLSSEKKLSVYDSSFNLAYQRYSNAESFTRSIHSPFIRYRWAPWFLRDSAVIAWIIAAFVVYIVFLILSFVNQAVRRGFSPQLRTVTSPQGFSASNFFFSFLPCLLGMALLLAWQPIDTYFRATQPLANLSCSADGATASRSLLLSYLNRLPIQTTFLAVTNRDYKVAYISLISVISCTLPILAGGIFTAQFFEQTEVRVAATMPAYHALCVFLGIYVVSFLVIWPKRKRCLPHRIGTLAEYLSFLYQSPLLRDEAFEDVKTKRELVDRLCRRSRDEADEQKYFFGIYIGRDGQEHLGVDRTDRRSGSESGSGNRNGHGSRNGGNGSGNRNGSGEGNDDGNGDDSGWIKM